MIESVLLINLIIVNLSISYLFSKLNILEKRVEFLEDINLKEAHTMGVIARIVDIIETQYENDAELIEDLEDLVKEVKYDEKNK